MAVLRYLAEELADALPAEHELSGFVKGMFWMAALLIVTLVVTTVAWQRIHP